jgi:hypothetical protein
VNATAAELQAEFRRLRDEDQETGQKRMATVSAYNRWFHQACIEGNPPDALQPNAGTELERFFARTIPGLDGHTYWAPKNLIFYLSGGGTRRARWWWYEHVNGPQGRGRLESVCGERNCITPSHQFYVTWALTKRRYTDEQLLGALQAVALKIGHTPTTGEYDAICAKPVRAIIALRFGGWESAVRAAGLAPTAKPIRMPATVEQCVAAVRFVTERIGHSPTEEEFRVHSAELRAAGLHSSPSTIYRCVGSWPKALEIERASRRNGEAGSPSASAE